MKNSTKTLLYVLGGLAVVGAGGTAIYFATKAPAKVEGKGSTPTLPPNPNGGGGGSSGGGGGGGGTNPVLQTTVPEINALLNLAQALAASKPDYGAVQHL